MRKLFIFLCFFSISFGICQTEEKQDTNSTSHKNIKEPTKLKPYNDYFKSSKATQNNPTGSLFRKNTSSTLGTNTSYGQSKYDKEINWAADIDPNNVEGSLEKFREEKRREEILFYTKIVLGILGCMALIYFAFKFIKTKKHSS